MRHLTHRSSESLPLCPAGCTPCPQGLQSSRLWQRVRCLPASTPSHRTTHRGSPRALQAWRSAPPPPLHLQTRHQPLLFSLSPSGCTSLPSASASLARPTARCPAPSTSTSWQSPVGATQLTRRAAARQRQQQQGHQQQELLQPPYPSTHAASPLREPSWALPCCCSRPPPPPPQQRPTPNWPWSCTACTPRWLTRWQLPMTAKPLPHRPTAAPRGPPPICTTGGLGLG